MSKIVKFDTSGNYLMHIDTAARSPLGVSWDGTNLWSTNGSSCQWDTAGTLLAEWIPASYMTDRDHDYLASYLWFADFPNLLKQYSLAGVLISTTTLTGHPGVSYGIGHAFCWDGTYWQVDSRYDLSGPILGDIAQFNAAGAYVSAFAYPTGETQINGLCWDGGALWVNGLVTRTIYRLTSAGAVLASWAWPDWITRGYGLAWDGTDIWMGLDGTIPGGNAALRAIPGKPTWLYHVPSGILKERVWGTTDDTTITTSFPTNPAAWQVTNGVRAVAYERGVSIYYKANTGTWGAEVLVKASRSDPAAVRLSPSGDVFVMCRSGTALKLNILRWNPGTATYTVDATEKNLTQTANATGDMWAGTDGKVYLCYTDTGGNIQVISSDASGATWS